MSFFWQKGYAGWRLVYHWYPFIIFLCLRDMAIGEQLKWESYPKLWQFQDVKDLMPETIGWNGSPKFETTPNGIPKKTWLLSKDRRIGSKHLDPSSKVTFHWIPGWGLGQTCPCWACWVHNEQSMAPPPKPCKIAAKSPDFIAKIHGILESKLVCWRIPRILCKKHLDLDIFLDVPAPKWNPSEFLRLIIICSIRKCQRFPTPSEKKMCFHIRISFPSVSAVHSQYHPYFILFPYFTNHSPELSTKIAIIWPCFPHVFPGLEGDGRVFRRLCFSQVLHRVVHLAKAPAMEGMWVWGPV